MPEEPEQETDWDSNRVYSDYREHTGNFLSRIPVPGVPSLPNLNISNPGTPEINAERFMDKRLFAAVAIVLLAAGAVHFDVADLLITTKEEKAVNIADQHPTVEAFREERGSLTNTASPASSAEMRNLAEAGALTNVSAEVYVVDYSGQDNNGVTAFVDIEDERVVETKNNLRIE